MGYGLSQVNGIHIACIGLEKEFINTQKLKGGARIETETITAEESDETSLTV
jgi:hypothetical protein